ncbi:ABC transporter ATP-binding protein [Actinoallomurus bryophytorum]|uniref:ATP-binding cassette subfamily C protein n=1 Tax=Actinoallomurus bryophytorum TaxID=1490222 RepID=A0A543CIW8_9ACTN|nr:ABC transporter ATP-binding protein [Actinoallomurus bryophytorum]TQL97036.1 ATP-binding cassette subfamily C protein [Actinoallomurus bryophytorum]
MTRPGLRLLVAQLRPHRRPFAALCGLSLLLAVPTASSGYLIGRALDDGFLTHRPDAGMFWLTVLAEVGLVSAILSRALFRPLTRIVEPLRDQLVTATVTAGLGRGLDEDSATPATDTLHATEWAETIRRTVGAILRNLHLTVSMAIGALAGLATLDPLAALIVAPCMLAALAANWALVRPALDRQRRQILAEEELAERVSLVFGARRDILACTAEEAAIDTVAAAVRTASDTSVVNARMGILRSLTISIGVEAGLLSLLFLAPWLIATGRLSGGEIVGAAFYVTMALGPALRFFVIGGGGWFVSLLGLFGRLEEVLPDTYDPGSKPSGTPAPPPRPDVTVDDVTFAYSPEAAPVLEGVSAEIPYGLHLAVVGPSGSGKSTLATLLCGLRPPGHGRVEVAGFDIAGVLERQRHRLVSLIPQEAYVFAGTLRENLAYLAPETTDHVLLDTAAAFGLDAIVSRLGGLDAVLPPGGAGLSAGERQLVALVRTYLSPGPIIVLDEATCHLDPPAERDAELMFARRPGTLIVIAHRISSAMRADRVLLVDGGRVATGTHDELLSTSPRYRELAGHWKGSHVETVT